MTCRVVIKSPLVLGMLSSLFEHPPLQLALNNTDQVLDFDSSKNNPAKPAVSANDYKYKHNFDKHMETLRLLPTTKIEIARWQLLLISLQSILRSNECVEICGI
ncbi:hypothetical protein BJ878DRAFT_524251 [Calycina marina]|uniref:Uncharacterized protein n=1 Tax=Calycina marina TaxID=1763456 RepID=A0A9P8CD02_9HELO|nr:hypothetical protein BJ878DRAFT_524251 [Calycina marina]